jgi:predicted nucleic acid-binding protein
MSADRATYVDSSALVKLAVREPETVALRRYLARRRPLVSSALARTEVLRALVPLGPEAVRRGREVLARVEIPCALPLILSGVRSAMLQIISTATIAAYTSLGGLGRYLIDGQAVRNYAEMLAGALLVAALALAAEGALSALSRPRGRPKADPLAAENEKLRQRAERAEAELAKARKVIEVQGNVSALLEELLEVGRAKPDESSER